ncbi:hypothetical protein [Sporosarcina sp. D27]|nr:hypothetical protein [Sporosarcina sp. D27]
MLPLIGTLTGRFGNMDTGIGIIIRTIGNTGEFIGIETQFNPKNRPTI